MLNLNRLLDLVVVVVAVIKLSSGETVCNGIGMDGGPFGSIPPGYCVGVLFNGTENGVKFECGTTPTLYAYDNAECSGAAINSTTDFGNSTFICDKTDCEVSIITVYSNDIGECTTTGDFIRFPVSFGGCVEANGQSQEFTCSGTQLTASTWYSSSTCSGNPSTTSTVYQSGCVDDVYFDVKCGAPGNMTLIWIAAVVCVLTSYVM
mmetsp:Transcript_53185/g.88164  ORF Transcript_53185/g.88164 Transcript_53185/m.88164 type:complete len:206 (-) Transcript_53185:218-835(-)